MLHLRLGLFILASLLASPFSPADPEDGPLISITSPDEATTFAYGTIKNHQLVWDSENHILSARVTFTDAEQNLGQSNDDTHFFRLPGVTFDEKRGLFFATSASGEKIPVARIQKTLFIKSIAVLPNAAVRILHPRGNVTVVLEAIRSDDPAVQAPAKNSNPDGTHSVDIHSIVN